ILLALLASSLTVGCLSAGAVSERKTSYAQDNDRRLKAATKDYIAKNHLTQVATQATGPVDGIYDASGFREAPTIELLARTPAQGLRGGEWLARAPAAGQGPPGILFASNICVSGDSCGCLVSPSYAFATAPDGHAVVLRLSPRIAVHTVMQSGSCSRGCGTPP